VREVRLHHGRHTAATVLLSEGVHPRVVMEVDRPVPDADHDGQLQPRHVWLRPRSRRPDGQHAVEPAGTVMCSSGHAGTKDDADRPPDGSRA
jgi:hypothetical protein